MLNNIQMSDTNYTKEKNKAKPKYHIKKEFYYVLVIILLVFVNIFSIIYFTKFYNIANFYQKKYPYIELSRNFIAQENYLTNLQPLRESLIELVAEEEKNGNEISLYFEYLNTGGNISINQDSRILPASLNKLPLSMVVMKKVEKGEWKLNDELIFSADDIDERYGDLYKSEVGSRYTIEFLLKQMLQKSDNTAVKIFVRNLDEVELDEILESTGLKDLFDENGKVAAKEYSRLFRTLYTASYLNRDNSQYLLDLLTQTNFNEFLKQGFDQQIILSHKFGLNKGERIYADSGIIYFPYRPCLITILIHPVTESQLEDEEKAQEIMKKIATLINSYISEK
jgi:beta-lactamase class A